MTPWLDDGDVRLYQGDALDVLRSLPDGSVHMCATSPPFYGLRDYGTGEWEGGDPDCDHKRIETRAPHERKSSTLDGGTDTIRIQEEASAAYRTVCGKCGASRVDRQIGLEETPDQWVESLVAVFREVRRVLRDDGTLWVEIGDSYGSSGDGGTGFASAKQNTNRGSNHDGRIGRHPTKPKDLLGQPWLLAFALRADGWYLRSEIIWARPNPMPESVTDRPTKAHSTVFLLSKRPRYFWDADAIRESATPRLVDLTHESLVDISPTSAARVTTTREVGNGVKPTLHDSERDYPANGANARSVWLIPTEPTPFAHFATWPQALVRRMVLAGTSERGCCPECGAPWVRETERDYTKHRPSGGTTSRIERGNKVHDDGFGGWGSFGTNLRKHTTTLGWSPSCACGLSEGVTTVLGQELSPSARPPYESPPVPCTVLDPFAGSGTTSLVARNHGRHSIGIELNPAYLEIAAKRLQQLSLLTEGATQ